MRAPYVIYSHSTNSDYDSASPNLNDSYGTDVTFRRGPATGEPLDASLQPGTGSTDLVVGAYYSQPIARNVDAFANVQFQSAVTSKQSHPGSDFRSGNTTTVSLACGTKVIRAGFRSCSSIFLIKASIRVRSPTSPIRRAMLLTTPMASRYQLFPRYTFSIGASCAF